jgi:hypothetical protein
MSPALLSTTTRITESHRIKPFLNLKHLLKLQKPQDLSNLRHLNPKNRNLLNRLPIYLRHLLKFQNLRNLNQDLNQNRPRHLNLRNRKNLIFQHPKNRKFQIPVIKVFPENLTHQHLKTITNQKIFSFLTLSLAFILE